MDEPIDNTPRTRLWAILGTDRVIGRNGHRQAVDRVGEGLVVAGRALDGIVESIEDPERWYLGCNGTPRTTTDRMRTG